MVLEACRPGEQIKQLTVSKKKATSSEPRKAEVNMPSKAKINEPRRAKELSFERLKT